MKRRHFLKYSMSTVTAAGLLAGIRCGKRSSRPNLLQGRRPNIILVMTDNQGYGDLSCHGKDFLIAKNDIF